jgi:hypothetical protein
LEGETPPNSNGLFPLVFENEASTPLSEQDFQSEAHVRFGKCPHCDHAPEFHPRALKKLLQVSQIFFLAKKIMQGPEHYTA